MGLRFEGHHLSFNFTVVDGHHVAFAPSFIGSNPAEVPIGPRKGERVLAEEDDLGRAFMKSLSPAQQKIALLSTKAPAEIFTTNQKKVAALEPPGLPFTELTPPQRDALIALVKLYIGRCAPNSQRRPLPRLPPPVSTGSPSPGPEASNAGTATTTGSKVRRS